MKTLVVITGPTASGKTSLTIRLAQYFRSEIINADSRQFYRGMNIGTAKPSESDLKKVPHHFIDSLEITTNYNIGKFEQDALSLIASLFKTHDILFLTGGSGLYINAVCNGFDPLPESDPNQREDLNNLYKNEGITALQKKLKELDPEYYEVVDINNPHRLIRALEIVLTSGQKYSSLRKKTKIKREFEIKKIGLLVERTELYDRINQRVDEMIKKGLLAEVKSLLNYRNENALQTVGYTELIAYFDKRLSLAEAVDTIKQNSRNYAKRQMTWFRRDSEIKWFAPDEFEKILGYIEE